MKRFLGILSLFAASTVYGGVTIDDLMSRTMCVNAWDIWWEDGNHPCD